MPAITEPSPNPLAPEVTPLQVDPRQLAADLRLFSDPQHAGDDSALARIQALERIARVGGLPTLEPILPLAFRFLNRPLTLHNQFPFAPIFSIDRPEEITMIAGRQVGKSVSLTALALLLTTTIPAFRTLVLAPLAEQIRRLSVNYFGAFLADSPIKQLWLESRGTNSVLQKTFAHGSTLLFSYMGTTADRVRGASSDFNFIDEYQDVEGHHLPVVNETLSASSYKLQLRAGTPKTLDNPIHRAHERSSKSEWIIRCGCGRWNIPSIEYDLLKMIGPVRDDISRNNSGLICVKCGHVLDPRPKSQGGAGRWMHGYPDRAGQHLGLHIPQVVMPNHYGSPRAWAILHRKMRGEGGYTPAMFHNEVLGQSADMGQKLVSETDLRNAAVLPWDNHPDDPAPEMLQSLTQYQYRALAVDWSGGGEGAISFTVLTLLGITTSGRIDCLWGKRLVLSRDHVDEALECLYWLRKFEAHVFCHDYTGAGALRETVLAQTNFPLDRIVGVELGGPREALIKTVPADQLRERSIYRINKTRTLLTTFHAIRTGLLRFFRYDDRGETDPGLLRDFLSLIEDKTKVNSGAELYRIYNPGETPDDVAMAVNIGCAALWHMTKTWPRMGHLADKWTPSIRTAEAYESPTAPWQ